MRSYFRTTSLAVTVLAVLAVAPALHAQLLVNPSGGSAITSGGDDVAYLRSLSTPFSFYGIAHGSLYVSTNGNLNFGGGTAFGDASLGTLAGVEGPVIAPMYDDLFLPPGTISDLTTSSYYAVTYDGVGTFGLSGTIRTFQTVLFTDAVTIGGFDFQSGDIAFSYGSLIGPPRASSATVGIAANSGLFTPLPGTSDGVIADYALVPTTGNQFVLFRGGANGYAASIETSLATTATPEPATMALLGTGLVGVFGAARRRRKQAA